VPGDTRTQARAATLDRPPQENGDPSDPTNEPTTVARDGAETTVVPSDAHTSAVELAWSAADTAPYVEAPADGRRPLPKTLLAFLAGVAVAAITLGAFVLGTREPERVNTAPTPPASTAPSPIPSSVPAPPPSTAPQPSSTTSVPPLPSTPAPEPPAPAPSAITSPIPTVPRTESTDDTFIARLKADGITFDSRAQALHVAHEVCRQFALGNNGRDITAAVKADNPDLPNRGAAALVTLSVDTYCAQYGSSS
ncbi:MAG: DUF732 domain-containing protein, partial [Mycobacterium sp.]|nr:DUF732 domain-containing protein [Mycobacterium sp.]